MLNGVTHCIESSLPYPAQPLGGRHFSCRLTPAGWQSFHVKNACWVCLLAGELCSVHSCQLMNLRHALPAVLSLALLCHLCTSAQAARRGSAPYQNSRSAKPVSTLVIYIYAKVNPVA